MRVGLDLLYLIPGETGGRETYVRELVPALLERAPELELIAFVNRDSGTSLAAELGEGVRAVQVGVSARNRAQWALGELALVSLAARRERVDLLHSMANFAAVWGPFRRVVTIHDLQYQAVPELISGPVRAGTSALMWLAAHRADRVIAVSGAAREEVIAGLKVKRERIDAVPNGVRPPPPDPPTAGLRERYRLRQQPIALAVATNLPHKNLPTLIDALALMAPERRPVLLLAGHGTDDGALQTLASSAGVAADVRLLGACSRAQLDSLYALADCLVLPTLHEGFGLPVIEAMVRSLPVACSDIAALREVAGDAALYFDPRTPAEIAARIDELLSDRALAQRQRERGVARGAEFSWSAAAAGTLESYAQALAS
jgi:glycosyltransferase involved in cell wall biosynthesis